MNKKIDTDFNAARRDEVFAHLYEKYSENFAHIGTHGLLQPKNAFKDVCRIFRIPFQDANRITSLIPDDIENISDILKDSKVKAIFDENKDLYEVIKYSQALEGTVRNMGVHACFPGDSEMITRSGTKKMFDMSGSITEVLTPYGWAKAKVYISGHKKVSRYKIALNRNDDNYLYFSSTPDHRIMDHNSEWKEAREMSSYFLSTFKANRDYNDYAYDAGSNWKDVDCNKIGLCKDIDVKKISFNLSLDLFRSLIAGYFSSYAEVIKGCLALKDYYNNNVAIAGYLSKYFNIDAVLDDNYLVIDLVNSFRFHNLIGLTGPIADSLFSVSLYPLFINEETSSYNTVVYDFEILTNDEKRRCAYVDGVIAHNCVSGDTLLRVDGKLSTISNLEKKDVIYNIHTPYGPKRCKIFRTSEKKSVDYHIESFGTKVTSLKCSPEHKIFVNDRYFTMKDFRKNKRYEYTLVPSFPSYSNIDYFFISGVILSLMKTNVYYNDSTMSFDVRYVFNEYFRKDIYSIRATLLAYVNQIDPQIIQYAQKCFELLLSNTNECVLEIFSKIDIGKSSVNLSMRDCGQLISYESYNLLSGFFCFIKVHSEDNTGSALFDKLLYSKLLDILDIDRDTYNKICNMSDFITPDIMYFILSNFPTFSFYRNNEFHYQIYTDKNIGKKVLMYDLTILTDIEEHKCYYANGFYVSNCGIVLSPKPLNTQIPLFFSDGLPVTQYDGSMVEKLGFIKIDLLGIKCLSIIDKCLELISSNPNYSKIDDIYKLPLDDPKTYEMLSDGDVSLVFQLEGGSIAPYVPKCKPKNIEDISAILATIRPGEFMRPLI